MAREMARNEALERSRLGELYLQHAHGAIRLAFLLTGDQALAEDLVQDAFVRLVGRFQHLHYPDAFGPYLRRTVVNLSRSHFRHVKVERAYAERFAPAPEGEEATSSADPDGRVHEALLRLPERQRAALVLRFYEDLSDVQTAAIMRCSAGTVRSLVSRGMSALRAELAGGVPR